MLIIGHCMECAQNFEDVEISDFIPESFSDGERICVECEHLYQEVFEDQEPEPCRTCAGTGIGRYGDPNTSNCHDCKGTGEEQDPEPGDWGES